MLFKNANSIQNNHKLKLTSYFTLKLLGGIKTRSYKWLFEKNIALQS